MNVATHPVATFTGICPLLYGVMLLLTLRGMTPSRLMAGVVGALAISVVLTVAIDVSRVVRAWEGHA